MTCLLYLYVLTGKVPRNTRTTRDGALHLLLPYTGLSVTQKKCKPQIDNVIRWAALIFVVYTYITT